MTPHTFFNYTGCFWKHYVELTGINEADDLYDKCIKCDNEYPKKCRQFTSCNEFEHILNEIQKQNVSDSFNSHELKIRERKFKEKK